MLAVSTIAFNDHVILSMYIYIYSSFFMIGFYINNKPLVGRALHLMELVNEVFVLITSYYLFLFSEFV